MQKQFPNGIFLWYQPLERSLRTGILEWVCSKIPHGRARTLGARFHGSGDGTPRKYSRDYGSGPTYTYYYKMVGSVEINIPPPTPPSNPPLLITRNSPIQRLVRLLPPRPPLRLLLLQDLPTPRQPERLCEQGIVPLHRGVEGGAQVARVVHLAPHLAHAPLQALDLQHRDHDVRGAADLRLVSVDAGEDAPQVGLRALDEVEGGAEGGVQVAVVVVGVHEGGAVAVGVQQVQVARPRGLPPDAPGEVVQHRGVELGGRVDGFEEAADRVEMLVQVGVGVQQGGEGAAHLGVVVVVGGFELFGAFGVVAARGLVLQGLQDGRGRIGQQLQHAGCVTSGSIESRIVRFGEGRHHRVGLVR